MIPIDDDDTAMISTKDKTIHYFIQGKFVRKATGFFLSDQEVNIMEAAIVDFLKAKNITKDSNDIKRLISE